MKVSAIIPAYNEERTISQVVEAAKGCSLIDEVIVVDDGSCDSTYQKAKEAGAKVIKLEKNKGKGQALKYGIAHTDAQILVFLDADLIGLKSSHLQKLILPVLNKEAEMVIGSIDRSSLGEWAGKLVEKTEAPFSGMRVLKREFWLKIPDEYKKKYYIESALSYFASKYGLSKKVLVLEGVTHIVKEKKRGLLKGFAARLKMFAQIALVNILIRFHQ